MKVTCNICIWAANNLTQKTGRIRRLIRLPLVQRYNYEEPEMTGFHKTKKFASPVRVDPATLKLNIQVPLGKHATIKQSIVASFIIMLWKVMWAMEKLRLLGSTKFWPRANFGLDDCWFQKFLSKFIGNASFYCAIASFNPLSKIFYTLYMRKCMQVKVKSTYVEEWHERKFQLHAGILLPTHFSFTTSSTKSTTLILKTFRQRSVNMFPYRE